MIEVKKGLIYEDPNRLNKLFKLIDLIKSDNISGHKQSVVVVYREVYPDITFDINGNDLIEYEFLKESRKVYMILDEFIDIFKNFELDKETILRIREGIYD